MPPPIHTFIGPTIADMLTRYVEAFPRAYKVKNSNLDGCIECLSVLENLIRADSFFIVNASSIEIQTYLNMYKIHLNQSIDEFKQIYFTGQTLNKYLMNAGHIETAKVVQYVMIGLLNDRLKRSGVHKTVLLSSMLRLIDNNQLEQQMGTSGVYLVYKCSSTAMSVVP
ncbi:MAG: hypothetical protein Hens3KO_17630 [Henriciella sp.]